MPERKNWSQQEDKILKYLKQEVGQIKWSVIAKAMQNEYLLFGRSGKQCRQRYHNHLDSSIATTEWTAQEQQTLYKIHCEVGNRWAVIAVQLPGRSDNCIKNHFYSKLRKGIRRINKYSQQKYKKEFAQIRTSLLYKIIENSESNYKTTFTCDEEMSDLCSSIIHRLLQMHELHDEEKQEENEPGQDNEAKIRALLSDILLVEKCSKKGKSKIRKTKSTVVKSQFLHPSMCLIVKKQSLQPSDGNSESSSFIVTSSQINSASDISNYGINDDFQVENEDKLSSNSHQNSRRTRMRTLSGSNLSSEMQALQLIQDEEMEVQGPTSDGAVEGISEGQEKDMNLNLFFQDSNFEMRILAPIIYHSFQEMDAKSDEEIIKLEDTIKIDEQ